MKLELRTVTRISKDIKIIRKIDLINKKIDTYSENVEIILILVI